MAEEPSWDAAIVAVEGPPTIVSTQLRLLPSTHQIMILPALQTYMPTSASFLDTFDPVQYIQKVNDAMKRRHQDAQEFLEDSSDSGRRLVFLEGGAASAQALCLKALMQHETAGDRVTAEATLRRLARYGLSGLVQASQERHHSASVFYASEQDDESSDPSTRAMRAADALDRQTANLQVSNELDLTIRNHSRSSSLPLYGYSDTPAGDAAPFLVFGQSSLDDSTPTTGQYDKSPAYETPRFSIVQYDQHGDMPSVFGFDDFPTAKSFASTADGSSTPRKDGSMHRRLASDTISPTSDAFSIRSVGKVEYGRASLLDVRMSVRGDSLMSVKALGKSTASHTPKLSEEAITETATREYNNNAGRQFDEEKVLAPKEASKTGGSGTMATHTRVQSTTERPRTIVVQRTRPVIKLQPVPSDKKRRWQQSKSTYIDDDGDLPNGKTRDSESEYEPIFPRMEDLVLYLRSDLTPQPLLDSGLNAMREDFIRKSSCYSTGSKASTASTESFKSLAHTDDETVALTSPETSGPEHDLEDEGTPKTAVKATASAVLSMDDYDPFAYTNPIYGQAQSSKPSQPIVTILRPPTPAQTPPPGNQNEPVEADSREVSPAKNDARQLEPDTEKEVIAELDSKIYEITVEPKQPPIAVQNSIRSILRHYYPAEAKAYAQFQLPQLLENEGLWRPFFRSRQTSSLPTTDGNNQLKQILAIGLQNGVKREYSARVIAQIEKFGTEPTGAARCTRLDFRYLLANTMQAFTSRPLASQTSENPFTNPHLLATLMLPHLETYLSMHSDIRFLILEYPPEHLSTIIAIQKLAGVDLVKIAQIVDSKSKERLPFRHVREGSISSSVTSACYSVSAYSRSSSLPRSHSRQSLCSYRASSLDVHKTKANFLLTSSASDRDIAHFVAAVWDLPVLERPQSAPEAAAHTHQQQPMPSSSPPRKTPPPASPPKQQKSVKRKGKPAPLRVSALSAFPKMTGPQSPLSPSANIMSVLAPPAAMTPPTSSKPTQLRTITAEDFYAVADSPSPSSARASQTPSPDDAAGSQHGALRMSAVGGSNLRRQASSSTAHTTSTMATVNSDTSSMVAAAAPPPHIARMRLPPPTSSRHFGPSATQQQQLSPLPSMPRYLDTASIAGSTLHSPMALDNDGASSIMTFDPAEESDYDQEERRLMPMFGKKRPRSKTDSQKAHKVLGMTA